MKKNLVFIAGVMFLLLALQRIIFPTPMKVSFTPNDLLLDVGITLLSAIIAVFCLFNYLRLLKKQRRDAQTIRKFEQDLGQ